MNISFCPILPGDSFPKHWKNAGIFISIAQRRGCEKTLDEILKAINCGQYLLIAFLYDRRMIGAMTLEQNSKALHLAQIAGYRFKEYEPQVIEFLKDMAKRLGKDEISGRGRIGWSRRWKKYGFIKRGNFLCLSVSQIQPNPPTLR